MKHFFKSISIGLIAFLKKDAAHKNESFTINHNREKWNGYLDSLLKELTEPTSPPGIFSVKLNARQEQILQSKPSLWPQDFGLTSFIANFDIKQYYDVFDPDHFNERKLDELIEKIQEWKDREWSYYKGMKNGEAYSSIEILDIFLSYLKIYKSLRKTILYNDLQEVIVKEINRMGNFVHGAKSLIDISKKLSNDLLKINARHRFSWALVAIIPIMLLCFKLGETSLKLTIEDNFFKKLTTIESEVSSLQKDMEYRYNAIKSDTEIKYAVLEKSIADLKTDYDKNKYKPDKVLSTLYGGRTGDNNKKSMGKGEDKEETKKEGWLSSYFTRSKKPAPLPEQEHKPEISKTETPQHLSPDFNLVLAKLIEKQEAQDKEMQDLRNVIGKGLQKLETEASGLLEESQE